MQQSRGCNHCYNFYRAENHPGGQEHYYYFDKVPPRMTRRDLAREFLMKLSLISASIFAYTLIAMAWICYVELALP
jgi:hypothetical protein